MTISRSWAARCSHAAGSTSCLHREVGDPTSVRCHALQLNLPCRAQLDSRGGTGGQPAGQRGRHAPRGSTRRGAWMTVRMGR